MNSNLHSQNKKTDEVSPSMGFSAAADIDNLATKWGIFLVEAFTMCLGYFLHIRILQSEANHKCHG
jgi:hypothetical protein